MLRVELRNAKPGMTLALPVMHPLRPGRALLKIDYQLNPQVLARMGELNVTHVWIRYPSLSIIDRFIDPKIMQQQGKVVTQITEAFNTMQQSASAKLPLDRYLKSIRQLVENLVTNPQAAIFMGDLAECGDGLMKHSSNVTYLSLLMGLKLEGYLVRQRKHIEPERAMEVTNLGLGAMMHDIGITRLAPEVRAAHEAGGGDDADPEWREHPAIGYELVHNRIAPSAATVVLNHHQRYDGSGYAGRKYPLLAEQRIHVYARIVGLAETFDRMRRLPAPARGKAGLPQIEQPLLPTVRVLNALQRREVAKRFDPQVLLALATVVPPYAPGSIVRLSDKRWAVVIDHKVENPCRPTVQLISDPAHLGDQEEPGETIDLALAPRTLFVAEQDGVDVSPFNFTPAQINKQALLAATW